MTGNLCHVKPCSAELICHKGALWVLCTSDDVAVLQDLVTVPFLVLLPLLEQVTGTHDGAGVAAAAASAAGMLSGVVSPVGAASAAAVAAGLSAASAGGSMLPFDIGDPADMLSGIGIPVPVDPAEVLSSLGNPAGWFASWPQSRH